MRELTYGLAALLLFATAVPAQRDVAPPPLAADSLFEFHSAFWVSLHHFLYHQARARRGFPGATRRAVAGALADTAGLDDLPESMRSGWLEAGATYEQSLAARDLLFDDGMRRINDALAALPPDGDPAGVGVDSTVAAALIRAAPAYRALWWPRHDRANQALIAALMPQVEAHGGTIARGLTDVYHTTWPPRLRVDVVPYAIWAGAYTTDGPPHITYGSLDPGNSGTQGLEILFHEASHVLADSVLAGLRRTAVAEQRAVPRDLLHAVIFYTAGEVVRREIPGHVPYAGQNGLWSGPLASYHAPLQAAWLSYLDGQITMQEALTRLVTAVGK